MPYRRKGRPAPAVPGCASVRFWHDARPAVVCVLLLLTARIGAAQTATKQMSCSPLSEKQVEDLLKDGDRDVGFANDIKCGVDFALTADIENHLRGAGAGESEIAAIRKVAKPEASVEPRAKSEPTRPKVVRPDAVKPLHTLTGYEGAVHSLA